MRPGQPGTLSANRRFFGCMKGGIRIFQEPEAYTSNRNENDSAQLPSPAHRLASITGRENFAGQNSLLLFCNERMLVRVAAGKTKKIGYLQSKK